MNPTDAVQRALPVFASQQSSSWDELERALAAAGIPRDLAREVAAFMPIAFGRTLMDGMGIDFPQSYAFLHPQTRAVQQAPLAEHPVYRAAAGLAARLTETQADGDAFVAVAVRSSEFVAINQALNAGSNPEDLELAPPMMVSDGGPVSGGSSAAGTQPNGPRTEAGAKKPWWRFW